VAVTFLEERTAGLLNKLLGRSVDAKIVPLRPVIDGDPTVIASYESDQGELVAVCICELEFVLKAGAALCLVPASEVAKNLKAGRLDPDLLENFKEVLNVCTQLFAGPDVYRVRLASVHPSTEETPEALKKFMSHSRFRQGVQLSIAGYGEGRISVFW
jgi:hypothetical protein